MGKVRTGHSTSLDGFIVGPNDGPEGSSAKQRWSGYSPKYLEVEVFYEARQESFEK